MPTFSSSAVTSDSVATAAQYNNLRTDLINQTGSMPDTKTAKTVNTVYQAGTNGGILVVLCDGTGGSGLGAVVYSDSSNPPTTVVGHIDHYSNTASWETMSIPIAPNLYYKYVNARGTSTANFYDHP